MYVSFSHEVLNEDRFWPHINTIFSLFHKCQHRWIISGDGEKILESRFCQDQGYLGRMARELYFKSIGFRPGSGAAWVKVTANPIESVEMIPSIAADYLSQPLSIVVEDSQTDRMFVSVLAKVFGKRLKKAIDRNDVVYEHGGGSRLTKRVEELATRSTYPPRLFVMSDSDRLGPGHEPQKIAPLITACENYNVRLKILEKREVENYIPPILIKSWIQRQQSSAKWSERGICLDTFVDLKQNQKSFFDMKYGFSRLAKLPEDERARQDELFGDLDEEQQDALQEGFGKDLWQALSTSADRRSLPREFRIHSNPGVPRGMSEVERLIRDIEQIL